MIIKNGLAARYTVCWSNRSDMMTVAAQIAYRSRQIDCIRTYLDLSLSNPGKRKITRPFYECCGLPVAVNIINKNKYI